MEKDKKILSDITTYMKYSRYVDAENRRESWEELCDRNMQMHIKKYPGLADEIKTVYTDFVLTKKVLPSMRSFQFAGKAIDINNSRIYNCAFLPIDSIHSFSETMFLLLGGSGVGYSVQRHHVAKIPEIVRPNYNVSRKYVVQDTIMGWADSVKALMKSYTGKTTSHLEFDFSDIREKGALLITAGGKAPGPEPLRLALVKIESILRQKENNTKLSTIEAHSIQCHLADAVLAGGIRRAAMIALFNVDDTDMLTCKSGDWYVRNPEFGRANNSAVVLRHMITKPVFNDLWDRIKMSGAGEPGIFFTNDKEYGTNPCAEISLRNNSFCNLTEVNAATIVDQHDLGDRVKAASFLGTLQAGYTDFHYLRDVWRRNTEKDALLGVSMTGIAAEANLGLDFEAAADIVRAENERVAKIIGINVAARTTTVKPAGTTSMVLGTSSGIHAWHDDFYIRRIRIGKNEAIYSYLAIYHPELIEDEYFNPTTQAVLSVPQKAPKGAITRSESSIDLLERVKMISENWVKKGFNRGPNHHNVSCTVSVKEDEWDIVRDWMWVNRDCYNGLSVLPHTGHSYRQAPFETIDEFAYDKLVKLVDDVDLTKIVEKQDNTHLTGKLA